MELLIPMSSMKIHRERIFMSEASPKGEAHGRAEYKIDVQTI
jgi:hypothetical protein